jgi:hypothetical protein
VDLKSQWRVVVFIVMRSRQSAPASVMMMCTGPLADLYHAMASGRRLEGSQ